MRMRYNPIHPKQNGNERDEYPRVFNQRGMAAG